METFLQQINLYTISKRNDTFRNIKALLKTVNNIEVADFSKSFNNIEKLYIEKDILLSRNSILFINDESINKNSLFEFLIKTLSSDSSIEAKKILYTASTNKDYINNLIQFNFNGIIHSKETPLLVNNAERKKDFQSTKVSKEKFIKIIRLIEIGCNCYDNSITSMTPKRYAWARDGNRNFVSNPITELDLHEQIRNDAESSLQKTILFIRKLSLREREVLLLIAKGIKNLNIARELNLAVTTVETHKANMLKKLELKTTYDLLIFAVRNEAILKLLPK